MARKAFVSSDMAHDEGLFDLAQDHPQAVLLWPWIITYLDDWGRANASVKRIKSVLFPSLPTVTVETIQDAIAAYASVGLLEWYTDGSHEYIAVQIDKWYYWQTHIRSDKRDNDRSKYPPCPSDWSKLRDDDCKVRAVARTCAQLRADRDPSPTPTPSLSPTREEIPSSSSVTEVAISYTGVREDEEEPNMPLQPIAQNSMPDPDSLDLDSYVNHIQHQLIVCGLNPNHIVREESYRQAKAFWDAGVPIQFVCRGIVRVFERSRQQARRSPKSFAYCAGPIEDLWAEELAKREPARKLKLAVLEKASPSQVRAGPYVPDGLPPEVLEYREALIRARERMGAG